MRINQRSNESRAADRRAVPWYESALKEPISPPGDPGLATLDPDALLERLENRQNAFRFVAFYTNRHPSLDLRCASEE
jgi:hypothetical protein